VFKGRLNRGGALAAAIFAIAAAGCSLGTHAGDQAKEATRITRLQAFYCATPKSSACQVRGDSIPSGALPPTDESFMVWAWHPGSNTTEACLLSSLETSCAPQTVGTDSIGYYFILNGAPAKTYTVRVTIKGVNNANLAVDSLRWQYP
jgi:hypothetical protein